MLHVHGFELIGLDCPTRKIISFVQEDNEEKSLLFDEEPN